MKFSSLFLVGLSVLNERAFADDAAAVAKAQPTFIENMIPFIFIFVLVYFLVIRPQVKKTKEHTKLLDALQVGDEVVTSGGLIGRVRSISEGFIVLDLGSTTVKVLKENITRTSFPKNLNTKTNGKDVKEEKNS
jgi:preprotein translocase subunit YajC